jgi:cytochrome b subunit of formate dehydrogenase
MALTGAVLWFPTFFTSWLPAWVVKISETIHLYEAWLATLAIAVFHFFFVIFHPDQYPMSLTWITGRMTVDSCKHHHPKWYERMTEEEKAEVIAKKHESAGKPGGGMPHV